MKNLLYLLLLTCLPITTFADASYDSEKNIVKLETDSGSRGDLGFINIYSEEHVELRIFALRGEQLAYLCSKGDSTIPLMFLDGNINLGVKPPKVTEFTPFGNPADQHLNESGYVFGFVFKGDDALDFIDLLYEYRAVGFAYTNSNCKGQAEDVAKAQFMTRGFDRAMKRLK